MGGSARGRSAPSAPAVFLRSSLSGFVVLLSLLVATGYVLLRTSGIGQYRAAGYYPFIPVALIALSMVGAALVAAIAARQVSPLRTAIAFSAGLFLLGQGFLHAMGLDVEGAALQLSGIAAIACAVLIAREVSDRRQAIVLTLGASVVALGGLWVIVAVVNLLA